MRSKKLFMLGTLGLIAAFATTACVIEEKDDDKKGNVGAGGNAGEDGDKGGDGGSAGDDGAGGSGGSGGSGGGGVETPPDYVETCGEADDNDTQEKAVPFGAKATLCLEDDDIDWMKVQTPDDGKAHLLKLSYDQPEDVGFDLNLHAGKDNSKIGNFWSDGGTKGHFYVTVGPNTTTYLKFERYGEPGLVKFELSVTPENDEHEPNNERSQAAQVNLNEDIKGQFWVPYTSDTDRAADDWFKADLAVGKATVKFTHVPENQGYTVKILDKDGKDVTEVWGSNAGAIWEEEFDVETAGTHYFHLMNYGSSDLEGIIVGEPKSLTEQYSFRIEQ